MGSVRRGVEGLLEALGQLGEVVAEAPAGVGRAGSSAAIVTIEIASSRRTSACARSSRSRCSSSSGASVAAASSSEMRSSSAISARPAAVSVSRLVRRSAGRPVLDEAVALAARRSMRAR